MERLGLSSTVMFTGPGKRFQLTWCDGKWSVTEKCYPAPGVPHAASMDEAVKVGTEWIAETTKGRLP